MKNGLEEFLVGRVVRISNPTEAKRDKEWTDLNVKKIYCAFYEELGWCTAAKLEHGMLKVT